MDPLSIVTLSGSVAKVCFQIATTLFSFARETNDIDDNLQTFATEISTFSLTLKAVTSTLNDPKLGFANLSSGETSNQDVWIALKGSIENLKRYMEKLIRQIVEEISKKGDNQNKNLFKQAIRAFESRLRKDNVNDLRSTLSTHHLSLNTALALVQIYAQAQLPGQTQPGLGLEIARLKRMADSLPEVQAEEQSEDKQDQKEIENFAYLKRTAMAVISNASERGESTIVSDDEHERSIDRAKIQQWIQLSRIAEDPSEEYGTWDGLPTQRPLATVAPDQTAVSAKIFGGLEDYGLDGPRHDRRIPHSRSLGNEPFWHGKKIHSNKHVSHAVSDSQLDQTFSRPLTHKDRQKTIPRIKEEASASVLQKGSTIVYSDTEGKPVSAPLKNSTRKAYPPDPSSAVHSSATKSTTKRPVEDVERTAGTRRHTSESPNYRNSSSQEDFDGSTFVFCIWVFLSFVQLGLAITVCVLYAYNIRLWRSQGESVDSRWVYAMFVGAFSAFHVAILRPLLFLSIDEDFSVWLHSSMNAIVFMLWLVLFGIFGKIYIGKGWNTDWNDNFYRKTAFIDGAGMALWAFMSLFELWLAQLP